MKRPPRPIRLVALDLDGTTLNPSHELNQGTIEVVRRVAAQGVKIVLASGRLPHSVSVFARQLNLPGVHIGLNGGVSFHLDGELRHKHLLTVEQLTQVHRYLEARQRFPLVFGVGGLWATQAAPDLDFLHRSGEPAPQWYHKDHLEAIIDPAKVVIVMGPGSEDKVLAADLEPGIHVVRSGPLFLEFMPPGVTKGATLAEYIADLGISKDEVMAVGDSENDASLFAAAGFSIAMGNAVSALRAKADAVTDTNEKDGVARALERFILDQ